MAASDPALSVTALDVGFTPIAVTAAFTWVTVPVSVVIDDPFTAPPPSLAAIFDTSVAAAVPDKVVLTLVGVEAISSSAVLICAAVPVNPVTAAPFIVEM